MKTKFFLLVMVYGVFSGFGYNAALCAQGADPAQPGFGISLQWRSETKNDAQLAGAMERLYLILYNTKNLPTKSFVDDEGLSVEKILRQNGLFFGAFFPIGVDSVICDLNPQWCSRERIEESEKNLKVPDGHVGGYKKTRGLWKNRGGSRLVVPNLEFSVYTRLAEVTLEEGESLQQIITQQNTDCRHWQLTCKELIKRLNPKAFDSKKKDPQVKKVIIPVTGVKTNLIFTADSRSKVLGVFEKRRDIYVRMPQDLTMQSDRYFAESWKQELAGVHHTDIGIKALSPNLLSAGEAKTWSIDTEPRFNDQRPLLTLIHHPFGQIKEIPAQFQKPIQIGVIDTWLDSGHCDLGQNVEVITISPGGSARSRARECGETLDTPNLADDHGTHVVGLISAMQNSKGTVGLNPFAKIEYVGIEINQLRVPNYRAEVATRLFNLLLKGVKTVNISWRYTNQIGGLDAIARSIEVAKNNTLFVVAAGNENTHFDGGVCSERPACLTSLDNVVTVVGLNRREAAPDLWMVDGKGSNSSRQFHIAAIAEEVLSTVSGGFVGRLSGTSQAAPQVTAAASMLYSVHEAHFRAEEPDLLPVRIKNRLIYTADIFTTLLDSVLSGRLNIERALDVARDYIVIKGQNGIEKHIGTISKFGNNPQDEHILCRTAVHDELRITRRDLRRMFFDSNRQKYVIFRNSISGNRNSPVERIVDCQLRTTSHKGEIQTDAGPVEFEFRQIRDYISPMFG